jgi:hypothetical protein
MIVRRAFFYWQFIAAILLPAWILTGWAIWGAGASQLLSLIIFVPAMAISMLAVAAMTYVRKSVRESEAVSWLDVAILTGWHAAIIAAGFFTPATSLLGALAGLIAVAAFWAAIWQLVRDTRRRVRKVFDSFGSFGQPATAPAAAQGAPIQAGEYIVIDQGTTRG